MPKPAPDPARRSTPEPAVDGAASGPAPRPPLDPCIAALAEGPAPGPSPEEDWDFSEHPELQDADVEVQLPDGTWEFRSPTGESKPAPEIEPVTPAPKAEVEPAPPPAPELEAPPPPAPDPASYVTTEAPVMPGAFLPSSADRAPKNEQEALRWLFESGGGQLALVLTQPGTPRQVVSNFRAAMRRLDLCWMESFDPLDPSLTRFWIETRGPRGTGAFYSASFRTKHFSWLSPTNPPPLYGAPEKRMLALPQPVPPTMLTYTTQEALQRFADTISGGQGFRLIGAPENALRPLLGPFDIRPPLWGARPPSGVTAFDVWANTKVSGTPSTGRVQHWTGLASQMRTGSSVLIPAGDNAVSQAGALTQALGRRSVKAITRRDTARNIRVWAGAPPELPDPALHSGAALPPKAPDIYYVWGAERHKVEDQIPLPARASRKGTYPTKAPKVILEGWAYIPLPPVLCPIRFPTSKKDLALRVAGKLKSRGYRMRCALAEMGHYYVMRLPDRIASDRPGGDDEFPKPARAYFYPDLLTSYCKNHPDFDPKGDEIAIEELKI